MKAHELAGQLMLFPKDSAAVVADQDGDNTFPLLFVMARKVKEEDAAYLKSKGWR